ncbi:hypothetical protein TSAR_009154 [Trichomalopsis sarcophagae]|uniref:BTB domain-containing protein n=1 Tax=Trichomalopsis sarcophagae TaxID=543379 RepID=A0A232FDM5_9HYME|nr:hypothetical protein TSAR_009154 [Trichomalopsis sarcophagae]
MPSKEQGEISIVHAKYKWVIDNFCTGCLKPGECLVSPTFATYYGAKKNDWYVKLYPKGTTDTIKSWISVFLCSSTTTDFKATATFKILNSQNEEFVSHTTDEDIFIEEMSRGFQQFVTIQHIMDRNLGLLTDGRVTIVCELVVNANKENDIVSVMEKMIVMGKCLRLQNELKNLKDTVEDKDKTSSLRFKELEELEQLIGETNYSDVELCVEGKTIRAHKCILALKSPVFAAMFQTEMKEKCENKVQIQDIEYSVFTEMLRYVYSCQVTDIKTMAVELLAAADRYSIDGLKAACERTICSSLSVDNAAKSLQLAERYRLDELRRMAIHFIVRNSKKIVDKPDFQLIGLDTTREILRAVVKYTRVR